MSSGTARKALVAVSRHPREQGAGVSVVRLWKPRNVDNKRAAEPRGVDLKRCRGQGREEVRVSVVRQDNHWWWYIKQIDVPPPHNRQRSGEDTDYRRAPEGAIRLTWVVPWVKVRLIIRYLSLSIPYSSLLAGY